MSMAGARAARVGWQAGTQAPGRQAPGTRPSGRWSSHRRSGGGPGRSRPAARPRSRRGVEPRRASCPATAASAHSGCTASKAAMAASGRAARKTPSISPAVTSGMARTRMQRPASAGEQAAERVADALDDTQSPARRVRARRPVPAGVPVLGRRVQGHQVGRALQLVDEQRPGLAPQLGQRERAAAADSQRVDERQQHARRGPGSPGAGGPWPGRRARRREAHDGHDHGGHQGRHEHPDVELLEASTSLTEPGHEVAAAKVHQAGRRQWLDGGVEPDPDGGQDAEHGAVRRVALQVAERGAGDGQHPDPGDRQGELGDAARDGGLGDEVGREPHESHVGADGDDAQQAAESQPVPVRQDEPKQAVKVTGGRAAGNTRGTRSSVVLRAPRMARAWAPRSLTPSTLDPPPRPPRAGDRAPARPAGRSGLPTGRRVRRPARRPGRPALRGRVGGR